MASSSSSSPEITAPHSNHNHNHRNKSDQSLLQKRLKECLEDLSSRFILNLPEVELASLERVCFQVEQAHWYYEDFIREEDPNFPTMTLKKFSSHLFAVCPLLKHFGHDHDQAFQSFLAYKTRVPVCGAIMLNEAWDKCLLVKGWKSTAAWSFPKGKINEQEPKYRCAIREVLEETGCDLESRINPKDVVEFTINEQSISLFIVPNIPEDFPFQTRTRKEISRIAWFNLADLPTWRRNRLVPGKFYLIAPFIGPLKAYIRDNKPRNVPHRSPQHAANTDPQIQAASDTESPGTAQSLPALSGPGSSSHSSEADNGDPPTPSPKYIEAIVHQLDDPPPDANGVQEHRVSPGSHLAFLLHSLSKSALSTPQESEEEAVPAEIPPPSRTPQAVSVSPVPSKVALTKVVPPPHSPPTAPHTVRPSPTPSRNSSSHRAASPFVLPRSPAPQPSAPSGPTASVSPRTARRNTGLSADISPYFTRAAPAAIPKQMRYLTMLENVAKESERMTPKLEKQIQIMDGLLPPHAPNGVHRSFPAPTSAGPGLGDRPTHIAGPGLDANFPPGFIPNHAQPDPFTVRPRTSNAFHPIPSQHQPHFPRASMNDEQLRFMMAGVGPRPLAHGAPSLGAFPPGPHGPGFPLGHPGGVLPQAFHPPLPQFAPPTLRVVPPQHLRHMPFGEPGPLTAPPISPTFTLNARPNPANNAHLLSILNAPGIPRAVTTVPQATTGSHA